jgi:hypothetical protein
MELWTFQSCKDANDLAMECQSLFQKFDLAQLADGFVFSTCGTMSAHPPKSDGCVFATIG